MAKKRIMVVEDEGITAMSMLSSLKKLGYSITSPVFSGEEAVKLASKEKPDLVLMDIMLRGKKDGIEAAGHIQSRFDIPVVFVTAHSDEHMLKRIKKTEPFGYIIKPVEDQELHIAIEIALYKHEIDRKLKESELRYRTLFKNASDAIYLVDSDTQYIIDCNPKAADIMGYSIGQLMNMKFADIFPEKEQGVVSRIFRKISEMGMLSDISGINQQSKEGRDVPVEINATTINLEDRKCILCIVRDITKRKKAEDELKESEERFHILFEQASDAIVIFDADTGELIQFNNKACENLGYTPQEFKKIKLSDIEVNDFPDTMSRHMGKIKNQGSCAFETKQITKEGGIRDVLVNAKVIHIRKKDYIQSIWIDITERKNMESTLKEAAITDELTGLFNRRGFFMLADRQCKLADRMKRHLSLLYLDVDGLKTINDELGHREGDNALLDTTKILKTTFRESDIIARLGGDEFAVLLTEPSRPDIRDVIFDHLQNKLTEFNTRAERSYELILSIGMTWFDPASPCSIDELVMRADDRMYEDKKHHKLMQKTERVLKRNGERRAYIRYLINNKYCVVLNDSEQVSIKDISTGGIRVNTSQPMHTSKINKIRIITPDNKDVTTSGVVVWSALKENKIREKNIPVHYDSGLKFLNMDKNVKSLIEKISHACGMSSHSFRRH